MNEKKIFSQRAQSTFSRPTVVVVPRVHTLYQLLLLLLLLLLFFSKSKGRKRFSFFDNSCNGGGGGGGRLSKKKKKTHTERFGQKGLAVPIEHHHHQIFIFPKRLNVYLCVCYIRAVLIIFLSSFLFVFVVFLSVL